MQAVGMRGQAPKVLVQPVDGWRPKMTEQEKYVALWKEPIYRDNAPGEHLALTFLQQAKPEADAEVIDFGCGTGRGALHLALFGRLRVHMLDFAENCLDPDIREACKTQSDRITFRVQDLTKPIPETAAYGYCCDVMEHIPTEDVPKVLRNILGSAHHVFFAISTIDDVMGAKIGETLHLTVKPLAWWLERLKEAGAVVHWSAEREDVCLIYCSNWTDAAELVKTGKLNVSDETIDAQVKTNIQAGWTNITPHERQNREVVLLAGGPSMRGQIEKIRELRAAGAALVTVNGAYKWALDQGLTPSVQIVLDAREFNARFTSPAVDTCRYLIASQCHPSTLEKLPKERTLLWHTGISEANEKLLAEKGIPYFPVPGGSTVVLRAFPLMRMLGITRFHVFGFDSCVAEDAHHAYSQPENDGQPTAPVTCGGRTFQCTPWQMSQASEFQDVVKFMGDEMELDVYGDGLIAQILKTAASFSSEPSKD